MKSWEKYPCNHHIMDRESVKRSLAQSTKSLASARSAVPWCVLISVDMTCVWVLTYNEMHRVRLISNWTLAPFIKPLNFFCNWRLQTYPNLWIFLVPLNLTLLSNWITRLIIFTWLQRCGSQRCVSIWSWSPGHERGVI